MALLKDIPKYGFSTAFCLVPSKDEKPKGENGGGGGDNGDACKDDTNNNHLYPKITEEAFVELINSAWRLGCRHFDCAPHFGTHKVVGGTLRKLMRSSGVQRSDVFITSRVPVSQMKTGDMIEKSFRQTIAELQQTHIDLYIVQGPGSSGSGCHYGNDSDHWPRDTEGNLLFEEAEELLLAAWKKLHDLKKTGLTRYIGVCNITCKQLDKLKEIHYPDVVQNEYHLYNQDRELFDYCEECDVHFEALVTNQLKSGSSQAGSGALQVAANGNSNKSSNNNKNSNNSDSNNKLAVPNEPKKQLTPNSKISAAARLVDPVVDRIANENKMTRPQVFIRWIHTQPLSYVIHTATSEQLEENLKATTEAKLSVNDLIDLDSLNTPNRPQLASQNSG